MTFISAADATRAGAYSVNVTQLATHATSVGMTGTWPTGVASSIAVKVGSTQISYAVKATDTQADVVTGLNAAFATAGLALAAGRSLTVVNGTLTFATGTVTTGIRVLSLGSGGSVSRTTGHVVGLFRKHVATGASTTTFEVGSATTYAPVTIAFWSDFQCPYCRAFEVGGIPQIPTPPALPDIIKNYVDTGKVKIVFMDFAFLGNDSITGAAYSQSIWKLYPDKYFAWRTAMYTACTVRATSSDQKMAAAAV